MPGIESQALNVQEAMRLSDQQKGSLLKARNKYLTEVGHLLEERRRLQGVLKVAFTDCAQSSLALQPQLRL